jgi:hypothetical protein
MKLYLDIPGIIFVLACDLGLLARGVASSGRQGRGEGVVYLEKIVQVAYRVPRPTNAQIRKLIDSCSELSRTEKLINEEASKALAERTQRNPRRIKRVINSFILEYALDPSWADPPLGVEKLINIVLLYQIYPELYEAFFTNTSRDAPQPDAIGDFLGYVKLGSFSDGADGDWHGLAEDLFGSYQLEMRATNRTEALDALTEILPEPLARERRNRELIALLTSLGDAPARKAVRDHLLRSPLRSERGLNALTFGTVLSNAALQAGIALNAGTDELQARVMETDLAAAREHAQYQELQIESDANNAAASSVAQAAQLKMQTNSAIFQGFDKIISG